MARRSISPTKREKVWQREKYAAYQAGLGSFPICIHCSLPVHQLKAWHVAHRKAHAFDGKDVLDNLGVAHIDCNLDDGAKIVTPAKAKADAVRRHHNGAGGPGLGKSPMRGGRRDNFKICIGGGRKPRLSHAEKHALFLAGRRIEATP